MIYRGRLFCLFLVLCLLAGALPAAAAPTTAAVGGLTPPQAGELLDFTAVSAMPSLYSVEEVCWYRVGDTAPGQMMDTPCQAGEFALGGRYLCRVYLRFAEGVLPMAGMYGSVDGEAALLGLYRGRWFVEREYTAAPSTRITALNLGGISLPAAGHAVREYMAVSLTAAAGCSITDVSWSLGGGVLGQADTFRAGDQLSCAVTVRAQNGFRFADQPTATLCGKVASAAVELTAAQVYRFVFLFTVEGTAGSVIEHITVGSVALTLTPPAAGAAPGTVTASNGVRVIRTEWTPAAEIFAAGQIYTVTVTLAADAGFAFPRGTRPIVTLGGSAMQISYADTRTLTASYTFPAAEVPYVFPFSDVAEDAWYYNWVEQAHRMGLINGKSETTYVPEANMTWAEAVKLAACLHQLYVKGEVSLENGNPWYLSYLDYCRAEGIVTDAAADGLPGYAEIITRAAEPISRAAYVRLFGRAMPDAALAAVNAIPDGSIPDVTGGGENEAIYRFYRAGILNGTDARGTFLPESQIRRSDVAAILVRLMDAEYRVGAPAELGK